MRGNLTPSKLHRREFLLGISAGTAVCAFPKAPRSSMSKRTGYYYDANCLNHPPVGTDYPERLSSIHARLSEAGLTQDTVPIVAAPIDSTLDLHLLRVHTQSALDALAACGVSGTEARRAAAGVIGAVKAVCEGTLSNAFCAIRPPGHHAHDNPNNDGQCQGQGFCFLSNVVIAARYAQQVHGINKVMIIDWDYHHGNGTEDAVYGDDSILFFDTHDNRAYPEGGYHDHPPHPNDIHVHFLCGTNNDEACRQWDEKLLPAAELFKPDLVLISAGFDSKAGDLLGCFAITAHGFSKLTLKAMEIAQRYAEGRLVSMLEGGYADRQTGSTYEGLSSCAEKHLATLISAELQPEADYFTSLRRVGQSAITPKSSLRVHNGIFYNFGEKLSEVRISDTAGKMLWYASDSDCKKSAMDLRDVLSGAGRYVLSARNEGGKYISIFFELP